MLSTFRLILYNMDEKLRASGRFLFYLPRVKITDSKVTLRKKVIYTVISLLIFLVCSELPLYGVHPTRMCNDHPFKRLSWISVIYGNSCGTVMEMGILPIVASRTFMQILRPTLMDTNLSPRRRVFLHAKNKLLGIMLGFSWASSHVFTDEYGSMDQLGMGNAILILFQLCFGVIILTYLDELLQNGYGFGSGISLFSATNICQNIIWNAFYEQELHNVTNLLATVLIFLIVIYLQGFCVLVPLRPRNDHEQQPSYPIKLFYTSYMPILCLASLVSSFHLFSLVLHINFSGNLFVDLLGKWKQFEHGGVKYYTDVSSIAWKQSEHGGVLYYTLVGGIASYITAPSSLADMAANPFHALFYLGFVLSTCAFISIAWTEISFSNSVAVVIRLREQMIRSQYRKMHRYIPTAAVVGGMCIGALTMLADVTGAFSSASGILLAVTTISQYFEAFEKEKVGDEAFQKEKVGNEEISKLYKVLWKVQAPQSALHLAWRIFKRKIATKDSLLRRQIDVGDQRCVLCRSDMETIDHLFFTCLVSRQVWMECYKWGNISTVLPNQAQEHFMQHTFPGVKTKGDNGWKTVWIAAVFSIWHHRNAVVFNDGVVDAEEIQTMTMTRSWVWLNATTKGAYFSYSDWIGNPQICLQYLDKR